MYFITLFAEATSGLVVAFLPPDQAISRSQNRIQARLSETNFSKAELFLN